MAVVLAGWFGVAPAAAQEQAADKPNIIFIVVDDMGYADLGSYGGEAIETPNLDRMAAEGMRFTQAYSGCTVCAPARSTLMTGYHMGRTSVRGNTGGIPLRDKDVTVAEVLQQAGYATGGFGKWGLGDIRTPGAAEKQGFDTFFGYYHQVHAHYYYPDYLIRDGEKVPLPGNAGFYEDQRKKKGFFPAEDPETGRERQFSHYLIFDEMTAFIREHSDEPFFCYAAWTPPHGRYEMPADDPAVDLYKDKDWPIEAKVIAAMDSMMDRQVGELFTLLEELGIDENTVVFFTSDNGAARRLEGVLDSSGPLRGHKRDMYEGGIRVPLIARWPGRIEPASTSDHLCYFPDVMPTLAQIAGAEHHVPGDINGISFLPELTGGEQQAHDYLYWAWPRYNWGKREYIPGGLMQAVRVGQWKGVRQGADQPWELYNLSNDLGERNNLAAAHPEIVARIDEIAEAAHTEPREQVEPEKPEGKRYR